MYFCLFKNGKPSVLNRFDEGALAQIAEADYAFKLSSADSMAEAINIAAAVARKFDANASLERNIAVIERFLGELDLLDREFTTVWNNVAPCLDDAAGLGEEDLLEYVAGCGGVPMRYAQLFVTHAADSIVDYVGCEEDLAEFFTSDAASDFAQECRRIAAEREAKQL